MPLKLLSSMAPKAVIAEALAQYEARFAIPVSATAGGGVDIAKRVAADERVDIVVLAQEAIARLVTAGKLWTDSCTGLMTSGIAVAVRAGLPLTGVTGEAELRQAVLQAASGSYSTGPSGTHVERLFERWGITDTVRGRIKVPPPGVAVATLLQNGEAELGFQQLSELIEAPGVEVLGPLPASIQLLTTFTGAVSSACRDPAAARHVLEFLAFPERDSIRHRYGMSGIR